jgi:hypothetical protein
MMIDFESSELDASRAYHEIRRARIVGQLFSLSQERISRLGIIEMKTPVIAEDCCRQVVTEQGMLYFVQPERSDDSVIIDSGEKVRTKTVSLPHYFSPA